MMYFNKKLAIGVVLIVIVNHFGCDGSSKLVDPVAIDHLKIKLSEYAYNRSLIEDAEHVLKLKLERGGYAGTGSSGVVWICTLHYNTKKSIMTKIRKSLTLKRSNSQRNSADNSKEVTANQWDGKMIAVKFGINYIICKDELDKYFKFNAKNNPAVEFYGIPALYFIGVVMGQHPTFGLTMFEESIDKRFQRPASLSELNLLCMLYQAMFSIKFIHGHGVIHGDIKAQNFMIRYRRLFLIDFDMAFNMNEFPRNDGGNFLTGSISVMFGLNRFWMDDLKSLYYMIIKLAGVTLPWDNAELTPEAIRDLKLDYNAVRNLCMQINSNYTIVRRVFQDFHDKVMLPTDPQNRNSVQEDKRIPLYDEIGEIILKGIEEILNCRDVLFKWIQSEGEGPTIETLNKSSTIIEAYKSLPGAQLSNLSQEERDTINV